ncbi:hypothetical protein NEUTE2DRAFT_57792, partial [Neurospora tetrasperma FGSC 2509]
FRKPSREAVLCGFRLPWPPSCCQDVLTPFVVSDEPPLRHLNPGAEDEIAFRLLEIERLGTVKYDDFRRLYELNQSPDS